MQEQQLVSFRSLYNKHDSFFRQKKNAEVRANAKRDAVHDLSAIKAFLVAEGGLGGLGEVGGGDCDGESDEGVEGIPQNPTSAASMDGFKRMERCRLALDALDQAGWKRSFHQRKFHDAFLAASARVFFKLDPAGSFQRAHQKILEINNWQHLKQEILISTPRRFGKTISVSLFAAALMFSCAGVELSIYSTCKRISQKLLRNVVKFLGLIYETLGYEKLPVIRANCEEIHIQGPEGSADVRITNSYPSKVSKNKCVY